MKTNDEEKERKEQVAGGSKRPFISEVRPLAPLADAMTGNP